MMSAEGAPDAVRRAAIALAGIALSGCLTASDPFCADGTLCPAPNACAEGGTCGSPSAIAACVGAAAEASCLVQGLGSGVCAGGVCQVAICGNAEVEFGELCDDGNLVSGDDCRGDCRSIEGCGNGVIDVARGEECDCGEPGAVVAGCDAANGLGACRANCLRAFCGNGLPDIGEVCDDGNLEPGDGCRADCASDETCGNGEFDFFAGELCDDGNPWSHDGCASSCAIEALDWAERVAAPTDRREFALAYDPRRQRVVLFGGATGPDFVGDVVRYRDDTWEWDGQAWTARSTLRAPSPRAGATMVFDGTTDRVLLFGGLGRLGTQADTWSWDGAGWTRLSPARSPQAVHRHAMAYDGARRRVVLFGGNRGNGSISSTWEWDGVTWTQREPAHAPPRRDRHALAYDPRRGATILFGGFGAVDYLGDTWAWDGADWQALGVEGPSPRHSHGMAFDVGRGGVVLTGGRESSFGNPDYVEGYGVRDTWAWDGELWRSLGTAVPFVDVSGGPAPLAADAARGELITVVQGTTWRLDADGWRGERPAAPDLASEPLLAFDAVSGQVVMFAPYRADWNRFNTEGTRDETWVWDGARWRILPPSVGKPAETPRAMATDPVGGVLAWSGATSSRFDGTSWSQVATAGPLNRVGAAMSFDPDHARVVLFGGVGSSASDATWSWDGTSWTLLSGPGPAPRHDAALAHVAATNSMVLFGGWGESAALDDTWELVGATWTQRSPASSPPARAGAILSAHSDGAILLGGYTANSDDRTTYRWDGATWTALPTLWAPRWANSLVAATDATRGRVVAFGPNYDADSPAETFEWDGSEWLDLSGLAAPRYTGQPTVHVSDPARGVTWRFERVGARYGTSAWAFDGAAWSRRTPRLGPMSTYEPPAMSYDAARAEIVAVSGGRTWSFDGATWTDRAAAPGPADRRGHALAAHASRGELILFGGEAGGSGSLTYLGDTWRWDGTTWAQATPATSPSARSGHLMIGVPSSGRIVLVGGGTSTPTDEVWEWDGDTWLARTEAPRPPARRGAGLTYDVLTGHAWLRGGTLNGNTLDDLWSWDGAAWLQHDASDSPPPLNEGYAALVHEPRTARTRLLGTTGHWELRWTSTQVDEACDGGGDYDGDGAAGCADLDCAARCTPTCVPAEAAAGLCNAAAPGARRCGDGTCGPTESCRLCPSDCGACAAACGDQFCDAPETSTSCPGDCPP